MCQIFVKKPGQIIPFSYLRNAFDNNPDGLGILYVKDGEVEVIKELASWSRCQELIDSVTPYKAIIHFRYGTSGALSVANLHPFPLDDDWWLFHNGILDCVDYELLEPGLNDTQLFIKSHMSPLMKHNSENILGHLDSLGMVIGQSNRMVLVAPDGEFHYINRNTFIDGRNDLVIGNRYSMVVPKPDDSDWIKTDGAELLKHDGLLHDRYSGIIYKELPNKVLWNVPSALDYSPVMQIEPDDADKCNCGE